LGGIQSFGQAYEKGRASRLFPGMRVLGARIFSAAVFSKSFPNEVNEMFLKFLK
jgi:hypothetical protein